MEPIRTYQNPILTYQSEQAWPGYGFGDPFVMRYNGVYYLYVSTKDGSVGIKCWSSTDLVNWSYEGFCSNHPLTRGAYAPEVYYYNGYFYMYTSPAGNGHYVLRSSSPTKGFDVVTDNMGMSIDGSVFVDHDGKWYFYTAGHGAMQVYDMMSPLQMNHGRGMTSVSVNGGWTEGPMVVFHDGYYYMTYTGNHVLSPSYRILYGISDRSPLSFDRTMDRNPLLVNTSEEIWGIGHSSTVKGPDLDSYYLVYHALLDTTPNRTMNIDRIVFNGTDMEILGPTTTPQQIPDLPDVYHYFAPGSSLKGWSLQGSLGAEQSGLCLSADSMLICKTPFAGDFTAEYNIRSIESDGLAGALFAYTDAENFGTCCFSPADQKVIIEMTVAGEVIRTEVDTIRSFGENTRFDCLQSLQIERSGQTYTFYMNDRLLCTVENGDLTGGSIGYVTRNTSASFGFIGGTAAVGGRGGADQYKTVSARCGFIPGFEAIEDIRTVAQKNGKQVVSVSAEGTLSYRILAAFDGEYDLSILGYGADSEGTMVAISVDGRLVGSITLSASQGDMTTAILRGIPLTRGQHMIALRPLQGSMTIESLQMLKAATPGETILRFDSADDQAVYSDGSWMVADGVLVTQGGRAYGKRLYGSSNMGDYEVEVTVMPKTDPNCGLLVRATNPGSPAFLHTPSSSEDAMTATDWVEGYYVGITASRVIIGKQSYSYRQVASTDGQFNPGKTYKLKVICEGARILVYVDGQMYLDFTDPEPYMQGMVGVRVHDCAAVFDDLTITPLN